MGGGGSAGWVTDKDVDDGRGPLKGSEEGWEFWKACSRAVTKAVIVEKRWCGSFLERCEYHLFYIRGKSGNLFLE